VVDGKVGRYLVRNLMVYSRHYQTKTPRDSEEETCGFSPIAFTSLKEKAGSKIDYPITTLLSQPSRNCQRNGRLAGTCYSVEPEDALTLRV
jgi:hypothetical protein